MMPRYFIDTHDGEQPVHDSDGSVHDCHLTARREAIAAITSVAKDALLGSETRDLTVKITSETGEPIYEALLSFRGGWIGSVP